MGGAPGLGGGEKEVEASGDVMSRPEANMLGHAVMAGTTIARTGGTPFVCTVATTMAATPTPPCPHLFLLVAYGTTSSTALFPFFFSSSAARRAASIRRPITPISGHHSQITTTRVLPTLPATFSTICSPLPCLLALGWRARRGSFFLLKSFLGFPWEPGW
jgi:hypothetical protein